MRYYIKEWPNHTASVMAEDGHALGIFESIDDAVEICITDCLVEPEFIERHFNYLGKSPMDFESSFLI